MSTAFTDSTKAIYDKLNAEWVATPVQFSGNTKSFDPSEDTPYLYFDVHPVVNRRASIGTAGCGRNRIKGVIYTEVRVPIGGGLTTSLSLIDTLVTLFHYAEFGGVVVNGLDYDNTPVADGNWYKTIVMFDYEYDYF